MSTSLDTEVLAALEQRRGDWQLIAAEAKVSYSWLSKFANGHIDNPGFGTLKRLHEYLQRGPARREHDGVDRRAPADQAEAGEPDGVGG